MLVWLTSLALAAAPLETSAVAGYYECHQMEMAGAIELAASGRFRYAFDYGAVSEAAEGRWSRREGMVNLTSDVPTSRLDPERSIANFADEALAVDGETLVLRRYDAIIRFEKIKP